MTATRAPIFAEMAVHEWPSHQLRESELACTTLEELANDAFMAVKPALKEHAQGGDFEGAPFAFLGHSTGNLVMVVVAKRVLQELGLEPAAVVAIERGAPHIPLFNEKGLALMKSDSREWMRIYNSSIFNTAVKVGGEKGQKMLQMWLEGSKHSSDTRPIGFHKFECDLLVVRAAHNIAMDLQVKDPKCDPEVIKSHQERDSIMNSSPGSAMDFDAAQFEPWNKWTSGRCKVVDVPADHMSVKYKEEPWQLIWEFLKNFKAPNPPGMSYSK